MKRKTQANEQERADRILEAAAKLTAHYGFDKTTMDDIAREAGVSKGALYLHWRSKDALFDALIYRESERLLEDMIARMEADPDSGTLLSLFKHALLATADNPLMRAIMGRDQRVLGDYVRRQPSAIFRERYTMQLMFVQQMQQMGLVRSDIAPELIAHIFMVFSYGALAVIRDEMVSAEVRPSLEAVVEALSLILPRGLAPEDGGDIEAGKQFMESYVARIKQRLGELREEQGKS